MPHQKKKIKKIKKITQIKVQTDGAAARSAVRRATFRFPVGESNQEYLTKRKKKIVIPFLCKKTFFIACTWKT
jgi:hypothetical protein